jgi:hypothetical protein
MHGEKRDHCGVYRANRSGPADSATRGGPGPKVMSTATLTGENVIEHKAEALGAVQPISLDRQAGRLACAVLPFGRPLKRVGELLALRRSAPGFDTGKSCLVLNAEKSQPETAPGFDKAVRPKRSDPLRGGNSGLLQHGGSGNGCPPLRTPARTRALSVAVTLTLALNLVACGRNADPVPAGSTAASASVGQSILVGVVVDTSVPDASLALGASDDAKRAAAATETAAAMNKSGPPNTMSEEEESKAMPLSGQANDHSAPARDGEPTEPLSD